MSNSTLSTYTNISTKSSARGSEKITRIIVHHMAGVSTAKACCDSHKNGPKSVSATYYIGKSGDIAQGVDESRRPWTSGSWNADKNAVTIEVSNSAVGNKNGGDGWLVSEASFNSLINLCTDICKRNGISKLTFTGNKETDSLSCHRQWDETACPGNYLYGKLPELAEKVNILLTAGTVGDKGDKKGQAETTKTTTTTTTKLYRIRKTWADASSQIGAYKLLSSAKKECKKHSGYSVYDSNGKCVYTALKSVEEIAKEVVAGKWGNGSERRRKLTQAGYDYTAVQKAVNKLLK